MEIEVVSGEEKRREDSDSVHVHMYMSLQGHFYISEELQPTFLNLKKILKRENLSLSKWVQRAALEYVRLHEPGNPQTSIKTFTDPKERGPMKVVCTRIRGAMSDGHVLCDREHSGPIWIQGYRCYGCKSNRFGATPK